MEANVVKGKDLGSGGALYTPPRIPGWTAQNPGGIPGIHVDFWVFKGLLIASNESTNLPEFRVFHLDSIWNMAILSTWTLPYTHPHIPDGMRNPHGFHMDSRWIGNFILFININNNNSNKKKDTQRN